MKRVVMGSKMPVGSRVRIPWTVVLLAAWLALIFQQDLLRAYDTYLRPRPWITATLELVPFPGGAPLVKYTSRAQVILLDTTWRTRISTRHATKTCGGQGVWTYRPGDDDPNVMNWDEFHGKPCTVPKVPFRVCVSYAAVTETGVRDVTRWFCSNWVDPARIWGN